MNKHTNGKEAILNRSNLEDYEWERDCFRQDSRELNFFYNYIF